MRLALVGAALAIIAGGTSNTAAAQTSATWITTVGGGVTVPVGGEAEIMEAGIHGVATFGYRAAGSRAEWAIDASYHHLANDLVDSEAHHILTAMARVNYDMGTSSYLIGAAGLLRNEYTEPRVEPAFTNTKSAVAIAAGAGLRLGSRLFGEARVIHAFTEGGATTLVPVTIGVRF